jgi:Na+/phosphate symporter
MLIITAGLILRNYLKHRQESAPISTTPSSLTKSASKTVTGIIHESADNVAKSMYRTSRIFNGVVEGLSNHDANELKKMAKRVAKLEEEVEELRNHLFYFIKSLDDASVRGSNFYIMALANLTDVVQSLELLAKKSFKHVDNHHKPLSKSQLSDLKEVERMLGKILVEVENAFKEESLLKLNTCLGKKAGIMQLINDKVDSQIARTRDEENSPKNTTLYFNLLLESKDLARGVFSLVEEYHNGMKGQ